jgi:myo-inositol-1(or 4)-monophosphatase
MTPGRWAPELVLALDAVRQAGAAIMPTFRTAMAVRQKGPDQPVTEADLAANAVLAERLLGPRGERGNDTTAGTSPDPSPGWLSEETTDRPDRLERERVWVVDPLDGTRSFVGGYREFAVSVALVESGQAVVGVVYNPGLGDAFWAVRGEGAYRLRRWKGGMGGGERLALAPPRPGRRPMILASRTEIRRGELEAFRSRWDVRPMGSTAYKLALVAAGVGDAFLSRGPKSEWDVAAGGLIVEEAGGRVTELDGAGLVYNRADPYVHGVLAAHPTLHDALMKTGMMLTSPRLRARGAADG